MIFSILRASSHSIIKIRSSQMRFPTMPVRRFFSFSPFLTPHVKAISASCGIFLALASSPLSQGQITSLEDLQNSVANDQLTPPVSTINTILPGVNPPTTSASASGSNNSAAVFYSNPGPWGKLRCAYIYLEAPKTMVDAFPLPSTQPRWSFPRALQPALPDFLLKSGLGAAFVQGITAEKSVVIEGGYVHLFPSLPDLEAISPESRAIIYSELSKYNPNEFQVDPVLIIGQTVDEWYRSSKLRPELIAKIRKYSYQRGETTAFSDVSAVLNYCSSDSEARQFFKALTRTRALMVRMELDKQSNVEELTSYWSLGAAVARRKDIEPLIQSIIDTEGIESLGLVHILPSLPRKLLYTYPSFDLARNGVMPDCHWTSLNFFNYEPHEYLLDSRLATSNVLENFMPVEPPYRYGDVLFFLSNTTGDAYHSCVHLADNLVYTKNGRNVMSPWVIMRMEDVKRVYLYKGDGHVQGYRRKDIFKEPS